MEENEKSQINFAEKISGSLAKAIVYIVLYTVTSAIAQYVIFDLLPKYGINLKDYITYAQILLAFGFGWRIVSSVSNFMYWTMRTRYDHPAAAAIKNVIRIVGVGALAAAISGGVAGGAAGVALGGFLGMVVGFATQGVLGQAVAGLFLLVVRPFKISDAVVIAGESGIVEDVSALFTRVVKDDGTIVLIPNNAIIGGKIYLKPKQKSSNKS